MVPERMELPRVSSINNRTSACPTIFALDLVDRDDIIDLFSFDPGPKYFGGPKLFSCFYILTSFPFSIIHPKTPLRQTRNVSAAGGTHVAILLEGVPFSWWLSSQSTRPQWVVVVASMSESSAM